MYFFVLFYLRFHPSIASASQLFDEATQDFLIFIFTLEVNVFHTLIL